MSDDAIRFGEGEHTPDAEETAGITLPMKTRPPVPVWCLVKHPACICEYRELGEGEGFQMEWRVRSCPIHRPIKGASPWDQ